MSGMTLEFKGKVKAGKDIMDVEASTSATKTMPAGVYYFLIDGWDSNNFETIDPVLETFLTSKDALAVYQELVEIIKTKCKMTFSGMGFGTFSSSFIKPHLRSTFIEKFAAKGITCTLNKLTVNPDKFDDRVFTWIELSDAAVSYESAQAVSMKKGWFEDFKVKDVAEAAVEVAEMAL